MAERKFYFTTRDLLVMATLAALGGLTSTFINTIGDTFQAFLGFPGATQWAAGFHILWLILSYGIVRKPGTGILTGILKGSIELLSGNTHGVIILLVDIVAGLIIDLIFFVFQNRKSLWVNMIAAGLASASNIFVFQIFASLPADSLTYGFLLIVGLVAFLSGVIFAALLGNALLSALNRAGIIKEPDQERNARKLLPFLFAGVFLLSIGFAIYLMVTLKGSPTIQIKGSVSHEINFPISDNQLILVEKIIDNKNIPTKYTGYLLLDVINLADPYPDGSYILMKATDGYSFFLSFKELKSNPEILLVSNGKGSDLSFDVIGPQSTKAWIRNVSELIVISPSPLLISGILSEPFEFVPEEWLTEMDSISIDIGNGNHKYQGVPIYQIIKSLQLTSENYLVSFITDGVSYDVRLSELPKDGSLRLFVIINESEISYALATMSGEVLAYPVNEIIIK